MAIKLLTLNIEADRHLARVGHMLTEHRPDIVCLQEVLEPDCERLAASGGYEVKYAVSGRVDMPGSECHWGVAVLSRLPVTRQIVSHYSEDASIRLLHKPNDARRVLLVTELEHQGQPYRIATTHFTWTPDGMINDEQKADFIRLQRVLAGYPDYVLCGDFNAPRGAEMFGKFLAELNLIDHLPANVTSTLDPQWHRLGNIELVVDTIFSTAHYQAIQTRVLEGISDHKGIMALIERRGSR
ncbi:endonuclease/exonuclease/phosphatase family protein [Steroidobacter sp. S1-65]|uniref:Endonuclease/exonuclease/phosphatase family protein n=1 Tax=Steroidobacter gossypii TaxID=2805490 RepID=A0ABS1X0Q3_9GAMM|nr:endonuclease/exonuclease/phosphatase family protein [Steroidobacter gossypii]MBM0106815.1 endonuclease/exonuclease/phosphatase family protein [Steroidobacter gossypii]